MLLRWLEVKRFRNLKPTRLDFQNGLNVFLGKNGSGKTTLLEIVTAITTDDFSRLEDDEEEFALAWALESTDEEEVRLEVTYARTRHFDTSGSRGNVDTAMRWARRLELTIHSREGVEYLVGDGSRFTYTFQDHAPLYFHSDSSRGEPQRQALLSMVEVPPEPLAWQEVLRFFSEDQPGRFDEALGCLGWLCARELHLVVDTRNRVVVGSEAARDVLRSWIGQEGFPEGRRVKFDAFGYEGGVEVGAELGFEHVEVEPQVVQRNRKDAYLVLKLSGIEFRFYTDAESFVTQDKLSFGQKRMFSLLAYLALRRGPLVLDEPANGLHYDWILRMFELVEGRQTFLATQHPFLLDHVPVISKDAVKQGFFRCRVEDKTLAVRGFTDDEAQRMVDAYDAGFQQLSEVLRAEQLW
jgi:energy-coupling factor transporter ATP-binding protein EcfA2